MGQLLRTILEYCFSTHKVFELLPVLLQHLSCSVTLLVGILREISHSFMELAFCVLPGR